MKYVGAFALLIAALCQTLLGDQSKATPPATQPATAPADLSKNTLVQKALDTKAKAEQQADAEYQKKVDAAKAEHDRVVVAAQKSAVADLRRAEMVAKTLKKGDEAETIKALADSIEAEGPTTPTPQPKDSSAKYVGHWTWGDSDIALFSDMTSLANDGNKGVWAVNNGEIVIKWNNGWSDVLRPDAKGQYTENAFSPADPITEKPKFVRPAHKK